MSATPPSPKNPVEQLQANTKALATLKQAMVQLVAKVNHLQKEVDALNANGDLSLFTSTPSVDTSAIEKQIATLTSSSKDMDAELRSISQSTKHEINQLNSVVERMAAVVSPDTQHLIISLKTEMTALKSAFDKMEDEQETFKTNFINQNTHNLHTANDITTIRTTIATIITRLDENDNKTAELFSYRTTMRHVGQTILGLAAILGTAWAIYSSISTP